MKICLTKRRYNVYKCYFKTNLGALWVARVSKTPFCSRRKEECIHVPFLHTTIQVTTSTYLGLGTFNIQFKSLNFKTRRFIFGNCIFSSLNPWRFFANPPTHLNTQQLKYILPYIKPSTNFSFFTFSPWKKEFQTIFWWYPEPAQYKWSQRQGQSTRCHFVHLLSL